MDLNIIQSMKRLIFPDETITCNCGFKGNLRKMEKHFKNTWTWNQTEAVPTRDVSMWSEIVSAINKHDHTRVLN